MTAKFDAFKKALEALCVEHGVQLAPDKYDTLQVWDLSPGDQPLPDDLEDQTKPE